MAQTFNVQYHHTQTSPLHYLLYGLAALNGVLALLVRDRSAAVAILLVGAGLVVLVVALSFGRLTVQDEGDALGVRFGPLPLFRKRIAYADITGVERARSSVIDGWGVHYVPGRGWTYNLWGFDCVRVRTGKGVIQVGSDDAENLAAFLRQRTGCAA